jgi:hypothetical protein
VPIEAEAHGVLFRGNVEAAIRKNLIRRGLIKGIIGLPANLFYGTGIPACIIIIIIIIDKEHAQARTGIFGEEGLLEDAKTDKGKVTKASVKARMKELLTDGVDASLCSLSTLLNTRRVDKCNASTPSIQSSRRVDKHGASTNANAGVDTEDELAVLRQCQELLEDESEADKKVKDAQKELDAKVFAQYAKLSEAEIKQLALDVPPGYKQTEVGRIPEIWKVKSFSDFCLLQRGGDITEATRIAGDVPVYSSSGLSYFHKQSMINAPGVVTGRKGILGKVFYIEEPFWPHDTTLWVKDFKGNDPKYVSDMDAEITALEARHDKTQAIKQGMMQELLTGKTRLIENGQWGMKENVVKLS